MADETNMGDFRTDDFRTDEVTVEIGERVNVIIQEGTELHKRYLWIKPSDREDKLCGTCGTPTKQVWNPDWRKHVGAARMITACSYCTLTPEKFQRMQDEIARLAHEYTNVELLACTSADSRRGLQEAISNLPASMLHGDLARAVCAAFEKQFPATRDSRGWGASRAFELPCMGFISDYAVEKIVVA